MTKKTENIILATSTTIAIGIFIFLYFKPENRIVREARRNVGEEELANNSGFKNPEFEELMKQAGFISGSQWCNIFAEHVWVSSLFGKKKELAKKILTPSTQLTWANFVNDKSGKFEILIPEVEKNQDGVPEIKKQPKRGSLVVWRSTTNSSKGHIGIVINSTKKYFKTIEGNSNNIYVKGELRDLKQAIRKGDELYSSDITSDVSEGAVGYHIRQYDGDGMKLLGFINIK